MSAQRAKQTRRRSRISHLPLHTRAADRPAFSSTLLVVKCKADLVANVPDIQAAYVASLGTMTLPEAAESPFHALRTGRLLREVIPVFSRLTGGRSLSTAPMSVAASFATSVRDSENEDLRGVNMLRLSRAADLSKVEKDLRGTPGVDYVHRVPLRWISGATVNDPMLKRQWALPAIHWLGTPAFSDAHTVKVAVLDTGVDTTHADLMNMVTSYVHEGATSDDIVGHGTHVSGIIAAEANNKIGIAGVAQCDLAVWKIFSDKPDVTDGEYYVDEVMYQRALNAARNAGTRVLNLSIGGTASSRTEEFLFQRLINAGCLVAAAMGNEFDEGNPTEYPAAYDGVMAVGATTRRNTRAWFSNTGRHIALAAPGSNILSTLPLLPSAARKPSETKYAEWSGTSMATPHVTAAAALVLAKHPAFTPSQVGDRLKATAAKVSAMKGQSFTRELGAGLLDVQAAVS